MLNNFVCGGQYRQTARLGWWSPMTSIIPMRASDLLDINAVNLDVLTETYTTDYYMEYLIRWPSLMFSAVDSAGRVIGYMIGKSEGEGLDWHSHITAVTVDKDYRRLQVGKQLVDELVVASESSSQNCYFMDLYVRASNKVAVDMYKKLGFHVFRRVKNYYSGPGGEDAFDMRRPLARDTKRTSLTRGKHTFEDPRLVYDYRNLE